MPQQLSPQHKIIEDKIKSLTESQGYGEIVIVVRAGCISQIKTTTSEKYEFTDQREEPGSVSSCK